MAEDSQVAYSNGYENGKSASAAEIARLQAENADAREIIEAAHDYLSCDWFPHKSRNGNDKAVIEARARAFLKRSDKTESDNGGCQAKSTAVGDTVSAPMEPLQASLGAEAVDRGLPRHLSLHFCANSYGFLSVYSDDVPEFYISGSNDQSVTADIEPVLSRILWENYGTTIAGFCRRQVGSEIEEAQRADTMPLTSGETPDTENQDADNG